MAEKVLLDTDIGSDIDDAVCLAYLLAEPECELLGITTVSGQPAERAKLASAICRAAGKGVAVYPGSEKPLKGPQRQPEAEHAAVLSRWPHQHEFPDGRAVEFMAETVRASPGQVILLSIGPMTNVARLFQSHPDVPGKLKGLMLMAGHFGPRQTGSRPDEWNVYCDPDAAEVVYRTRVASHRSVGVDVTTQVQMNASEVRRRFDTALLLPVLDMAEVYFSKRDVLTFHDPLAAVCIFDDGVCVFQRGEVTVETRDEASLGLTGWSSRAGGPHEVAVRVHPARFFSRYFGVFGS